MQSLSFGLMDFVSAHRGAIPQSAMGVAGQFAHPLVVRAKLEIAAACHGAGKVPCHCVVTAVDAAIEILLAAQAAHWAPIRHHNTLHDRASDRDFWQVILRARRTGQPLPAEAVLAFFDAAAAA